MTDPQLLRMLREKPADAFTPPEIQFLRERLAESAELRGQLTAELLLRARASQILSRVGVSLEDLLYQLDARQAARRDTSLALIGLVACAAMIVLTSALFLAALDRPIEDYVAVTPRGHEHAQTSSTPDKDETADKTGSADNVATNGDSNTTGQSPREPENPDAVTNKLPLTIEAENFTRGDALVDAEQWGNDQLTIIYTEAMPGFVEYEFELAEPATLELKIRYASFDSRPLQLSLNGQPHPGMIAGEQTGGYFPDNQKWFTIGEIDFAKGTNVLRLETTGRFPHLDQLVVAAGTSETPPTNDPMPIVKEPGGDNPPVVDVLLEKPPWQEVLERQGDPPSFADACFEDSFAAPPQSDDLQRWFELVGGSRFHDVKNPQLGSCGAFAGIMRLLAPWREDTALRLSLERHSGLQIHFFNDSQGVTLAYYEGENFRWAAYRTTREPDATRPLNYALAASDNGRNRRTEIRFGGPFEIRHHDGQLILSRGDIVLLRTAMPDRPTEVYFDGQAEFRGIALIRTKDFPERDQPRPAEADVLNPAELKWGVQRAVGTQFANLPDGAIELSGNNATGRGWAVTRCPDGGIQEVVLQIEKATPGSGVFLGRGGGRPYEVLRFMRNRRDGTLCLAMRGDDDVYEEDFGAVTERMVPLAGDSQWVRLLMGCGMVRWWTSTDGENWAEPQAATINVPSGVTHIGLHHVASAADCRIRLRGVTWRRLDAITSLADAALLEKAESFDDAANYGAWLTRATISQPQDVELNAWRRACAIQTLAAGCSKEVGHRLVEMLLDDAASRGLPLDEQLTLLDEATLLVDTGHDPQVLTSTIKRYRDLALAAHEQNGERPFSFVRRSLMTAPIAPSSNFAVADNSLIRAELIQLLSAGQWQQTVEFCRRLRFFQQHHQQPLVEWAEVTAARQLPRALGSGLAFSRREDWQHPLEEELDKDAYNMMAELHAVLESEAFDDAARMLTSVDPLKLSGIAPCGRDRQLLVSLAAATRLAVRDYPQLRELVDERFGPLAQLRVRQAIAAGDTAAVRLVAMQFESTPGAAEAHQWLGDRALSSGWFTRALAEYRRAEKTASASLRQSLSHRIRLAAAMIGREVGEPATGMVALGEMQMPAGEFEKLVAEMIARNAGAATEFAQSLDGLGTAPPLPPPTALASHVRSRLDGAIGDQPGAEVTPHVRRYGVDWAGRQIATVAEGDLLYVSNRFQVAAYDLSSGQRKWQSPAPSAKMLRSQEWTLAAMRPLVTEQHIFARQLYGHGPMLVCVDKPSGQIVWEIEMPSNEFLISDPMLVQDQLVALTLLRTDQRDSLLRLTTFSPQTGEVLEQHELIRLRESWWRRRHCGTIALDETIVAALGGLVICCDLNGDVRWLRKQIVLPPAEEPEWVMQYLDRPLLDDGRLFITQPGVPAVDCLDPDTGSRHWTMLLSGVRRIVGVAAGRVVVETDEGLAGLDKRNGHRAWTHHAGNLLVASLCSEQGGVIYSTREPLEGASTTLRPRLVWLDAKTGRASTAAELPALDDPDPRIGPLLVAKDRLWIFSGRGHDDPNRDFVELVPAADQPAIKLVDHSFDVWTSHIPAKIHSAAIEVLPEWTVLSGNEGPTSGLLGEVNEEHNVLAIDAAPNEPVVLARRIVIPDDGPAKLRVRVGHPPGANFQLRIAAGNKILWDNSLHAKYPDQSWKDLNLDLSSLKGQTLWLTVSGCNENSAERLTTYWKRLELVF